MTVKKGVLFIAVLLTLQPAFSQDKITEPKITLKWAPTGLVLGGISLQGEYGFQKKSSLTAKIGVPIKRKYSATYDGNDADLDIKAFSFLAGFRHYLSRQLLKGFYIEPFFTYAHHSSSGTGFGTLDSRQVMMDFSNDYNGTGVGVQLGSQFIIRKKFVIDLFFFGPQVTSSTNNFKAVDSRNTLPWNDIEAADAEKSIREFIDQFPFIRNKVDVKVDKSNRIVTADFKGALIGIRFGVSFGVAL